MQYGAANADTHVERGVRLSITGPRGGTPARVFLTAQNARQVAAELLRAAAAIERDQRQDRP